MSQYTYEKMGTNVLHLEDGKKSSFYLIKGENSAALIDTGMGDEPLLPFIRSLTELPIILLVTHGHGDHIRHANEFKNVYLNSQDIPLLPAAFRRLGIQETVDPSGFFPVKDGQTIEFGDFTFSCVKAGGHSPGSMIFYEQKQHLLFTGDAVGSGAGVWLQLTGCLPISEYRENLKQLEVFWEKLPEDTQVYSGHYTQRFFHPAGDNPVCLDMVRDMITLCTLILERRENRKPAPAMMVRETKPVYIAEFGRASMVYTEQVIR